MFRCKVKSGIMVKLTVFKKQYKVKFFKAKMQRVGEAGLHDWPPPDD